MTAAEWAISALLIVTIIIGTAVLRAIVIDAQTAHDEPAEFGEDDLDALAESNRQGLRS